MLFSKVALALISLPYNSPDLRFAGSPSLPQAGKRVEGFNFLPFFRRRRREGRPAQRRRGESGH
jgi:hypothetical protein